jgi:HD-GYP domain-containing protein (c-di-GMP phosphodiesterase class II)
MANVTLSQLKIGDQLSENVLTKKGSLLLEKGKSISMREMEILKSFFIPFVSIESRGTEAEKQTEHEIVEADLSVLPFYKEYDSMITLLKRVFNLARTSQTLPILDIRTRMEALIQQIGHYNILAFPTNKSNEKEYMIHNSILVSLTSYQLAKWHGFQQKDLMQIALAGLLHDIGNTKIDQVIFDKTSRLTEKELEEMKKHTVIGYQILKTMPAINEGVKMSALQHHEKEDGTGYPLGVTGDKVHLYAKVVAIADIFHAMTSNRQYKRAISPYLVLEQLLNESFGKLDPALVQTFINRVTSFHNGTLVRLSDNRIGEIVFSDRSNPTRPWVNVNGAIVNLTIERSLFIQELIERM